MYFSSICLFIVHALFVVLFSLPLDVKDWLRLLIVAFPGLSIIFYDIPSDYMSVLNNQNMITESI